MKGKEKICVGIIHEVYLQKEDISNVFFHIKTIFLPKKQVRNKTCKSPCPSPLKVTQGGVLRRLICTLDPGHSRSSIASFNAAD